MALGALRDRRNVSGDLSVCCRPVAAVRRALLRAAAGAAKSVVFGRRTPSVPERQVVLGGGDLGGDEQRRAGVGARQRASLSDSPRLFERSERSERSEFCGATPDRAAQCSRSEAQTATA